MREIVNGTSTFLVCRNVSVVTKPQNVEQILRREMAFSLLNKSRFYQEAIFDSFFEERLCFIHQGL